MKNNSIPKEFLALESICPYSYQIKLSDYQNLPDNQQQLTSFITHIIEIAFQTLNNNKGSEIYLYLFPKVEKKPIKLVNQFDKMFADSIDEINNEPKYMKFTKSNLALVSKTIKKHLTPDLLPKKYRKQNEISPTFGHCHTASACLQKIFGSKNIKLYRGHDGEIYHWWAVDKDGKQIDLTADQYYSVGKNPPYDVGEKSSMLGFAYRTRTLTLLDKVTKELSLNGTPLM